MTEYAAWRTAALIDWASRLCDSFRHWTGRDLVAPAESPLRRAEALFETPQVVVSHGMGSDPVLNYGNRAALQLWEMSWPAFVATPSRLTAESLNRKARARILAEVEHNGYVADYTGVRISASGRRFRISGATIWNVVDDAGRRLGQAASFARWDML